MPVAVRPERRAALHRLDAAFRQTQDECRFLGRQQGGAAVQQAWEGLEPAIEAGLVYMPGTLVMFVVSALLFTLGKIVIVP